MSNLKKSFPICTTCTRIREPEGFGRYYEGSQARERNYLSRMDHLHKRLLRSEDVFIGVKFVYMKRLYIRETLNGRQKFRAFGWRCPECGQVIKTMRKKNKEDVGFVRVVGKKREDQKKYLGIVRLPKKARTRIHKINTTEETA